MFHSVVLSSKIEIKFGSMNKWLSFEIKEVRRLGEDRDREGERHEL